MTAVRRRPPPARTALAVPVVLVALLLAATGCSGLRGTGDADYVSGDGSVTQVAAVDRGGPIDLTGTDLDGEDLDLASFRGRPTVVNVWGAWCTECRSEADDVVAAARELEGTAGFVGINIRDSSVAEARTFVREFSVPFRSFYSPDGKALLPFAGQASITATPSTLVLDAEGRVAARITGQIPSTTTLVELVQDVADGSGADRSGADGSARG